MYTILCHGDSWLFGHNYKSYNFFNFFGRKYVRLQWKQVFQLFWTHMSKTAMHAKFSTFFDANVSWNFQHFWRQTYPQLWLQVFQLFWTQIFTISTFSRNALHKILPIALWSKAYFENLACIAVLPICIQKSWKIVGFVVVSKKSTISMV